MRNLDFKAILLATLLVFGIDFVVGLVLFGMFAEIPPNASEEQIRAVSAALAADSSYLMSALLFGTASTVVGGYLVARFVRTIPYFNALAFGVLAILLGLLLSVDLPLWFAVVGFGLTIPAALFGAYLRERQSRGLAG